MREILFRGKDINGYWIEGDLLQYLGAGKVHIAQNYTGAGGREVIPETVGQFTDLTDKNGRKIFEGDILEFPDRLVVVFWHTHLGCWDSDFLKFTNTKNIKADMSPLNWSYKSNVIGNIHDNLELLKGGEQE